MAAKLGHLHYRVEEIRRDVKVTQTCFDGNQVHAHIRIKVFVSYTNEIAGNRMPEAH
jgi:hypothetical protein